MFTLDQIQSAHTKVKSGKEFPAYISDLKNLGIVHYNTHVEDGHTTFYGENEYEITSAPKYDKLLIADSSNSEIFEKQLKAHQSGLTDYITFCNDCANNGVEKWVVSIIDLTCIYFDKHGNIMLVESIPQ